jgi:cytoskeleton protein RodZ
MKVPVKKLEALEADRLDLLPDAVFVRALAASVCRTLKVDAAPVLELLPASAPPRLNADDRGINTPFDAPGQANHASLRSLLLTPPALMVLLLMVAAVVVYFYPVASRDATVSDKIQAVAQAVTPEVVSEAVEPTAPAAQALVVPSAAMVPAAAVSAPANVSGGLSASPMAAVPSATSSAPLSIAAVSSPVAEAPKIAASATAIVSSGNLLQFKAKGIAWVQVTDAKGVQLISRTLQTGEAVGVAGALPLSVVVGRVDLTSVELRGKPYDLGAIAQNNVARFEVKQ